MKADLYNFSGEKTGDVTLSKTLFEAKINPDLMHRAVLLRLANKRTPVAHTQTRSEVTLVKSKAFRQKGTGRARRGALSTNLLRGGGVAHGPRNDRNFTKAMPKKERRAALFSSLSAQAKDKNVLVLESFGAKEPKTKVAREMLQKLPQAKKYLFVLPEKDVVFQKSVANLPGVETIVAKYLNPYDILHAEKVCFFKEALLTAEETFCPAPSK